jgi:hypothetical protein
MITNVQPTLYSFLVAALAQAQIGPDADQATKLRQELLGDPEGRGYANQPAEIVHMLLHGEYSKAVPERWEVKAIVTGAELKNWIAPLATILLFDPTIDPGLAKKWKEVMDTWAKVSDTYTFDPSQTQDSQGRPSTWHGLVAMAPELVNGAGQRVITAEAIRALTHILIPERVEMAQPRIEQVLGPGIVLSLEDVQEVM